MNVQSLTRVILLLAPAVFMGRESFAQSATVRDDMRYLASDQLEGRLLGSAGADSAAAYIARRFEALGLAPVQGHRFAEFQVSRSAPAAHGTGLGGAIGRNVLGWIEGTDPALREQYVIVGAHYDHLGHGEAGGSLDPESKAIHNGADDNASGTVALFEIARRLVEQRPARSVLFIAFSGEEEGVLGSGMYVKSPVLPLTQAVTMINLDMVGRLRDDRLIVYGVETAKALRAIVDSVNLSFGFDLHAQGDGYGPSDHASFYAEHIPVLHLFTDLHEDYHRPSDDWEKINIDGLVRVADYASAIARTIADRPNRLAVIDLPPPQPVASSGSSSSGYGAYLGSIPDMTDNPGGVRITGVRSGSPAEKAGLQKGDVIVRIGEHDVPDLMAMTVALRAYKPQETVDLAYRRDGVEKTTRVTFGKRGE